jgi:RND family efflux transporter MFP subunit
MDINNSSVNNSNVSILQKIKKVLLLPQTYVDRLNLPPWLKNKYTAIILVLCIVLFIVWAAPSRQVDVPVYRVNRGNFSITITESGELRAKNSISIMAPRIRGNLKIVYLIPEGTYVKPGDILCKFDPTEAMTSLKDAEGKLELALMDKEKLIANQKASTAKMESQIKSAELSFEQSKLKLEQVKFEAQATQQQTKLEHENNKLSLERTKQEYKSQKIIDRSDLNKTEVDIRQRQNELTRVKNDLQQLVLTAPSNGIVVYGINYSNQGRKFAVGDTPWGGAEILTLPDLSAMESKTNINEVDVSKIRVGQKVIVKLDAFQDSSFIGEISSIASIGKNKESNSTIKVFEALVSINKPSEILRPGMTTSNKMIINEIPSVIFVPQEAVFEKDNKKIVYVKNGSGFDEQEIEYGEKSEDYIIIQKGLHEGVDVALVDPSAEPKANSAKTQNEMKPALPLGKKP